MFNGSANQIAVGSQARQAPQQPNIRSGYPPQMQPPIQQVKPISRQVGHSAYPSTSYQQQQPPQMMPQQQYANQQYQQPQQQQEALGSPSKRKEIYVYTSPFDLYGMTWSMRPGPDYKFRLAVGSFIEEYNNKISLIQVCSNISNKNLIYPLI
jgi:hypothetical protein